MRNFSSRQCPRSDIKLSRCRASELNLPSAAARRYGTAFPFSAARYPQSQVIPFSSDRRTGSGLYWLHQGDCSQVEGHPELRLVEGLEQQYEF